MGFSRKTKLSALLLVIILLLSACTADNNKIMEDFDRIGSAIKSMFGYEADKEVPDETEDAIVVETEPTDSVAETEPVETISETEVTATPTPTLEPTPKATPTPEPTPEVISRVDFSNLTETNLTDSFVIEQEDFSESYGSDEETFVSFSGERLLVSMPENTVPAASINLMLNGFYQEAAGLYNRYSDEAKAQYDLTKTVDEIVSVEVHYTYASNDRILVVKMEYVITIGDDVTTKTEIDVFDMFTASRITNSDITDDVATFEETLFNEFEDLKLKKYDAIVLVPDVDDECIIWMINDGEFYKEHIITEEVSNLFNRYGNLAYEVA